MTIFESQTNNQPGKVFDTDAQTVDGVTATGDDIETLQNYTQQARRQLRAARLADAIDSLKGPMDPTATIAALRQQVVALRIIVRDLVDEDA